MKSPEKPITVKELMSRLENDAEYQTRKRKMDQEVSDRIAQLRLEQQPLIADLAAVGIRVYLVSDLINMDAPYPEAWQVLVKHLIKDYSIATKEAIARSLAVCEAREIAWDIVLSEYRKAIPNELITDPRKRGYKDGLAVALSNMADKDDVDVLLELIQEKTHGGSRLFFLRKLLKYKRNDKVKTTITKLKEDKDLADAIKKARLS